MAVLDLIADERRRTADLIEGLDTGQLSTPSLCGEWTVRDVGAHLLTPLITPVWQVLAMVVKSGGSFDRANAKLALRTARRTDAEIVAGLRENARHPFKPPTFSHSAPLTDLLVHGQDMRRPLGIPYRPDDEALRTALDFLTSRPSITAFVRKGTRDGLRFEATDLDWAYGAGALVRGTATSLVLAITGRLVAFDDLDGTGVPALRQRVS